MIYHIVFGAGVTAIGVWVLMLSLTFLPRGPALVVLFLIASVLTILLWRFFIQVHSRAQAAVRETFAALPEPSEDESATRLPPTLKGARLQTIRIAPESTAAGKLIGELALRTRTGASIVGIERTGASIINPGPDEELRAHDNVLLLGTAEQLRAAVAALAGAQ
jgi:CPA2 family monovalent cation:H+ antiporter-2